jgi:flagellar hook protein FlgE
MSLLNSLFSGVSGLRNHQSMMDVIGNDIANVNTVGYKGSRVTFADTFNQFVKAGTNPTSTSGGTNSFQIGLGSKLNSIDRNWTQGTFDRTGIVTDLALQGQGLFVLKSNGSTYYSRAGNFTFDANGYLVNPENGAIVQGKLLDSAGNIKSGTTLEDIKINTNQRLPAVQTENTKWTGNLDSSSSTLMTDKVDEMGNLNNGGTGATTEATASFKTIYDSTGDNYQMKTWYTYGGGNWSLNYQLYDKDGVALTAANNSGVVPLAFDPTTYKITTPATATNLTCGNLDFDLDLSGLTSGGNNTSITSKLDKGETTSPAESAVTVFDSLGNQYTMGLNFTHLTNNTWKWDVKMPENSGTILGSSTGTLTFDNTGQIASITQGGQTLSTSSVPVITFNPANDAAQQQMKIDFGSGTTGITQTSLASQVSAVSQDGAASATLSNMNIDQYGKIVGTFSNGVTKNLAQVMVGTFTNLNGLISVGDGMYTVAANTGDPRFSEPGENSATTIQSGALEQSNVDLSEEFTRMIVSQRGFQANARVITTSDSLLQEITNLIR